MYTHLEQGTSHPLGEVGPSLDFRGLVGGVGEDDARLEVDLAEGHVEAPVAGDELPEEVEEEDDRGGEVGLEEGRGIGLRVGRGLR